MRMCGFCPIFRHIRYFKIYTNFSKYYVCNSTYIYIFALDKERAVCYTLFMSDYFKQRDEKNLAKIDEILLQLPDFVGQFIVGISSNTSALTRLNYATDIRIFFSYLTKYVFPGKNLIDISAGDIESLKPYDIERYINGLSSYIYDGKKLSCGERAKERKLASLRSLYKYLFKKEIFRHLTHFFIRIEAHNRFFGNVPYDLIGFAYNGEQEFCAVLVQPYVQAKREATEQEIQHYMQSLGFVMDYVDEYHNETYEIFDAVPNNVLCGIDNQLYFIDTQIRMRR